MASLMTARMTALMTGTQRIQSLIFLCSLALLTSFYTSASNQSEVAATINGKEITFHALQEGIKTPLYDAQMNVYDIQYAQLQNLLLEEFARADPIGKNLPFPAFMQKHVVKNTIVTDQMVSQFIKINKIPSSKVNVEYRGQVTKYLRSQLIKQQVDTWFAQESKKHKVVINLKRPERPRILIPVGQSPTLGDKNAKITIIEYSDFQCPYCAKAEDTVQELLRKYGKDIRLVYKQYPLSFHKEAFKASEASLCANEQSNEFFWKLHKEMFDDPRHLKSGELKGKAEILGMDKKQFSDCLNSGKYTDQVNAEIAEGNRFGVNSTPIFFVNGIIVKGAKPFSEFEKIILEELKVN